MVATLMGKVDNSLQKAQIIFNQSDNLVSVNADVASLYTKRHPFLKHIVGEEGVTTFHPMVLSDITAPFKERLQEVFERYHSQYVLDTYEDTEDNARNRLVMIEKLHLYITRSNLIDNTLPYSFKEYVSACNMKGYSSPKLSKALVKLCGESSEVVKWYTNQCPKTLTIGANKEYEIHFSILPHHIAGMSYYAPYNWGGDSWREGWNYTSCMDTIRNSDGDTIYQLPPNLLDSSLAIAWLSRAGEGTDEPRMLARMLVRLCELGKGQYILIGQRTYFTSTEMKYILIEGLKNEFEMFYHVSDIRDYDKVKEKRYVTRVEGLQWDTDSTRRECNTCEGEGEDYDGDICCDCDGEGYCYDHDGDSYLPYNDDPDILDFHQDKIRYTLPLDFLKDNDLLMAENE